MTFVEGVSVIPLTHGGRQEERTTTKLVNSHRATDGNEKLQHVLSSIEASLSSLIRDTGTLVDKVGVVADQGVARVLGDDT